MNQREFAQVVIKCQPTLWSMCLGGKRNLGFEKARTVAHVLGTSVDLWTDPKANTADRVAAWKKWKEAK